MVIIIDSREQTPLTLSRYRPDRAGRACKAVTFAREVKKNANNMGE